jgi:deferrochelatase/peroxidase EfeB
MPAGEIPSTGTAPGSGADPVPVLSRRRFLGALGAGAAVAGFAGGYATATAVRPADSSGSGLATTPFYGDHQAGIATPAQDRLAFGVLNLIDGVAPNDVRGMLRSWTEAAARLTQGELVGEDTQPNAPPLDTGEAVGSPPAGLTITLGYGPTFFDRLGFGAKRPRALAALPALPNENLDPNYTGGDLCIQACSNDPLVAFHAVRNLARLGMGTVEHSWMELGFGRTSATSAAQATPRNLLGFKDGTRNIKAQDTQAMNRYVWVGPASSPVGSGCSSRTGIGITWPTSKTSSDGSKPAAPPSEATGSSTPPTLRPKTPTGTR